MLKISDVKIGIYDVRPFETIIAGKLGVIEKDVFQYRILRKSVDARKKDSLCYVYTFQVEVANEGEILKKKIEAKNN